VYRFETALVRNNGDGSFTLVPLPREAQTAPVFGILARDFDGDGHLDLLIAGNFDGVKPEIECFDFGMVNAANLLIGKGDLGAVQADDDRVASVVRQHRHMSSIRHRWTEARPCCRHSVSTTVDRAQNSVAKLIRKSQSVDILAMSAHSITTRLVLGTAKAGLPLATD
jgi:hypothetical protein